MSEPEGSGPETAPAVRAALAERLRRAREKQQGGAAAGAGRIPRRPAGEPAPLSRAQERLWFQERLGHQEGQASGSPLFNICRAVDLRGAVDAAALNAALAGVTARHGALASRFFDTADGPRQEETAARPRLAVLDLTALPAPLRAAEARRLAGAEARRPFRLDAPPLLRATLLRLTSSPGGAEHSRLLLTVHHMVFDGWSLGLLLRDLSALYRRHRSGSTPPAAPPLRFADFAAWERRPGGEAKTQEEGQLDYWRRRLAGAAQAELPELPLDRPRPASPSLAGGTRSFLVPAAVVAAADRLAAAAAQRGAARCTRFTVLLAAWAALLARWSGGRDLLVGTPLANRGPEVEGLVGFFVNTVSLRLDLAGDPSGDELVRRVGESVLEALANGTVPFARVVQAVTAQRESGAPRGGHLAHAPLHAVSFALGNAPRGELDLPGVTVDGIAIVPRGVTDQDLTLALEESDDGGLEATLLYAREVLDATTAERLGAAWVRLLAALTADPAARLSRLPLLSPAQRQQVLVEWAGEALRRDRGWWDEERWEGAGVAAQVAAQAARRPSAPALVAGDTEISYGELLRRADRLAARLSERLATQREALVALCLPRTPELVVAALAVLRAGAAYLPVDVGQPAERVAYLLDDSAASLVLARGELAAELAAAGRPVLDLGVLDFATATDGEAGPPSLAPPPHPDALAYVIYTSGSTGRPKGTLLAHRGLANLVRWHRATFGLGPGERATLLAGTGFDASVWETWSALAAGAALHLPAADVVAAPSRLAAWLAAERVSHCFLPTPLAEAVLAEPEAAALGESLRVLLVGGDRLHRHAGDLPFRLVNNYGPTESTVVATSGDVAATPPASAAAAAPPIGRPLPGVPAYVLDRHLGPLPPGAAGELCIGGVALARGYLGRPGLTAERFVPHPFGRGARLYRSGDLVRWRGDGQLDFLGRVDQQVKVRGFRIELGEIEAVLSGLPAVREAAVLVPAAAGGERRLVAYVVPAEAAAATTLAETAVGETAVPETLAAELRRRLPEYMVPAGWVVLDALPLTANGKVDRRALEALEAAHLEAPGAAADEAPRTPLEELVAGQFVSLLHAEAGDEPGTAPASVGRHADFFRLGGHSLLAARLVTRLRDAVGVEVPLRRVFEAPTVAAVAALVEEIQAGEEVVGDGGSEPSLAPVPREGDLPASFAQRRLWFLDQLEPGPAYNMPAAVDLEGPLDGAALAAACADLAARHEALRTTLPAVDGEPVQRMAPPAFSPLVAPLPVIDLAALPAPARAAEARRLGRDEGRRPFDLASGPLLRLRLLALGAADADDRTPGHRLLLTVHHAVSDGWSTGVLLRDLAALYDARAAGRPAALPELPVQYADYAAWERRQLSSEVMERHLAWWRGHLAGVPVLELPTDRPRSAVQRTVGRRLRVALPPDLAAAVRAEARRHGATPFMVLLAAFSALLSRHAGQQDFAVGTPVAGRPRRELDGVVGFFVDTLALRSDLAAARLFGDLVAQVRSSLLAAYAHQDLPFDRLVEELAPGRDLAHTPLFQVMFILQNAFEAGDAEQSGGGVRFRLAPVEATTSKFEATLSLEETADGGFAGWWVYRSDLFDAATARRMAQRYAVLLRAALEQPRRPLSRLPLLTAGERQQTLVDWNASRVDYDDPPGADGLLPALFAAAVARDPRAPALVWQTADGGLASLDYGALAARAERLARRLRALGVGPEVRVGICAERSPQTVVAVLGVLLSGGAYVPLDPALPADRLSFMLRDSRLAQVLVTAQTADALPAGAARLLRLDELAAADEPEGEAARSAPLPAPLPEATAYVIYTSGSTGTPKGVAVHHAALGNRLRFARAADLTPDDAFLHKTTLAFDVSVAELLAPLVSGARVVVVRPGGQADPAYLADLMARAGVTQSSFPPTLLEALLEHPGFAALSALRTVVTGGETVPAELPGLFYAEHPEAELLNRYGPTEATISVTSWTCPRGVEERVLPIGRPTAKARVYLLDRFGEPAPVGVPGEIHLGGACVARGYLARPAKTAEVFVPDPFAAAAEPVESGARLYKTGDLARWRPDGALEFVGRVDRQVKVRGYRIELGEIEAALRRHPAVEAAAVVDLPDGASRRLAAYLVAVEKMQLDLDEVRAFLADSLPEYMLPTAWTVLGELPLSATGKVDRKALPEPSRGGEAAAYVAPRDDVEASLAEIFAAVLGVDDVGVHDGFFDLGGHSLLATRLVSRMRQRFAADLPLRAVFEQPTVAGLAALLRDGETAARPAAAASTPGAGVASGDGAPLSFAQQRLWFLDRLKPGRAVYNLPAALRLRGPLDAAALQAAVRAIVERHQVLRTVFASGTAAGEAAAEEPVQRLQPTPPAGAPLVPRVDFSALPAGRRRAAARRELARWSLRPFDLARGPLGRYVLLRVEDGEHLFGFAHHHAVFDGWSVALFRRELAELYDACLAPRPPRLPELPIQYADYAVEQRQRAAAGGWDDAVAFWRRELADLAVLELPLDRPRPARRGGGGAERRRALPPGAVETLARVARDADGSLFMAALAVVQVLLARLSGQRDFAVGTPVAGRDRAATENLMGFFVNTLALRSDLGDDAAEDGDGPSVVDLLARVRRRTLAAYAHWELPFERLVEKLAPERDLSRTPLFQVLLLLRDEAAPAQRLAGGLDAEAVSLSGAGAKLDLTLALAPRAEGVDGGGDAKSLDAGWTLAAEYDPALFDATTVDRLLDRFGRLLAAAGEAPRTPVLALPWLAAAERQQLLVEWNDAPLLDAPPLDAPPVDVRHDPAGAAGTLHGAVLAGLAWRPDEVVVIGPRGEELTAGELDRRSAALAARLRRLGVGPEVPVGVALRREPVLVVALLAVLRAGGAYLPLDPTYPAERLAFMLADAAAPVVVADAASRDVLPPGPWHLLAPEDPEDPEGAEAEPAKAAAPALPATASPSNLAYFIYTSGSTGRPKGVAIPHAAAAALLSWARRTFSAAELSYVLAATSVCFDLSVFEIFTPLAAGGRLVLAADALAVADHPAAARVSLLNTVPSAASALLDLGALPPSLRAVHLAGEPLRGELVERLLAAGGDALRVRNLYGPSEDTTYSTAGEAGFEVAREGREPTLGRPLPGSAGHVVDRRLRLCPVGVAGELVLSGAGLARGYLGRPARTAASWVPDPFAEQPAAGPCSAGRLYRTGDLVRRLADGRLEFLGRIDQQVKVRGFRIELGEVEVALARHPAVREAAVLAAGDRLVAFALAADPAAAGDAALPRQVIAAAARLLPDYMLPSRLEVLAELPRTASGKVDRRALRSRGGAAPRAQTAGSAPRTRSERLVAELWRELLEVEEPTLEADFFHLGGHSLLATRLISRLARRTGVDLPLGVLFEARTVGELAARLEAAQAAGGAPGLADEVPSDPEPLPPLPAGVEPPLSYAQQRIWFLDRLAPGSGLYNVALALRLTAGRHDAALDVAALRAALSELLRRHAALRTRFPVRDGEPVQRVEPAQPVSLSVVDLCALAPALRPAVALALARGAARRPFDLEAGPLARFLLLRLGAAEAAGEHVLVLSVHHAVSDGWSFDLLRRELAALYGAFAAGRPSPLAEPELSYVDFSLWQRRWLSGDELERQLAFWRRELAGVAPLELPVDRPRPVRPGVAGGYLTRSLPRSLAQGLAELSRRRGSTLFMTALALFQALLARVCAQSDVALGTPVAGRDRSRLEGLVGCLVNTLVLRGDLADDPSFEVLLQRTRESSLAAFAHQDLPFERLVEDLAPRRELARHPLFQVMFTLRRHGTAPPPLPGLATEALSLGTDSAKFELGLGISETEDGGLEAGWDYRRDLFDDTSVARLARAWEALAAAALEQPEAPLSTLPLLAAAERHQVSVEWSGGDLGGGLDAAPLFHERVTAWAQERPTAVALVAPAADGTAVDEVTYGELLRRARRLAAGLRRHGVAAEEPVAVLADRSPETVVALLAVLLAGAVYLPLEPTAPAPRLSGLLRAAGVRTVLAHAAIAERLPAELRPLCFHHAAAGDGGEDAAATSWRVPHPVPHPEQAAYVVFTSGSTGTPKGVVISHRALARRLATAVADLGPRDVSLLTASLAFDVSLMQLAAPLAAGARVVLLPAGGNAAPAELVAALSRHRVSFADFPPLLLDLLLDEAGFTGAALPATLLVGNETVPPALAGRWAERVAGVEPRRRLHNRYGPTETTISVTSWPCAAADAEAPSLPIGRPVAGARTWVTDAALRLVGIGCLGELVVGGELVGRGYLGEPARTAAAFVPDPFSAVPGARLYRTGDHVRLRGDGALELHGRLDRQLKLRGFRVEPGEVEAALVAHPAVREAVVVASGEGESRWLAAYVGVGEAELDEHPDLGDELREGLREDLRSRLPEYMVPATVSVLAALPRGASGKVEAAALPAAALPASEGKVPRDDLERRLLALFEEVLERVPLGVADDFFAHGGHSLLAVRLVVRIEQELGRRLSPAELFLAPSVENLAAVLRRQGAEAPKERPDAHDPLVLLTPPEGDLPLFLVHPVGGDVFCYRELVTALAPVSAGGGVGPVYALRARGLEVGEPPYTSLGAMAERYAAAVRAARPAGPVYLGGWSLGGVVAFEMARRLSAEGVEVAAVVLVDSHLPSPPAADSASAAPARSAETRQRRLRAFARHLGLPAGSLGDAAAADGGGAVTLGRVLAAARSAGLLAPEVGIDVLRRLFTVYEAHVEAFAAYRPQPWDGRVVLLAAADAPAAVRVDVERWRRCAAAVDVHPVPGDHFTILQGDSARRVAEHLERILWRPAPAGRPR